MSAKVLVVDDVAANVKILEAKLTASYFNVLTAYSGAEALEVAERELPDLILLDVMMPGMNGFECCRRLKANPELSHIPVVMVTALDQPDDRVRGLEAGADDFLTKPPNDLALFARVRSLVRLKMMIDELRMRGDTFRDFGLGDAYGAPCATEDPSGRVIVVESRQPRARAISEALSARLPVFCRMTDSRNAALAAARRDAPDVFVISDRIGDTDGLRLCSELRSTPETRQTALIVLVDDGDNETIAKALDLGANDYLLRPLDENELVARVRSQLLRKSYADRLRENVYNTMRMALTDPLTGLYNRRYVDQHLGRQIEHSRASNQPLSVMLLDLDHFKRVNDEHGHAAGDAVLVEFAQRMRQCVRGVDLIARQGGEEFMIAMPETDAEAAMIAAERVRVAVAEAPFLVGSDGAAPTPLKVTVSIGVATLRDGENAATVIQRADVALYRSKSEGRNRATLSDQPLTLDEAVA
ncbi:MAG: PleD family two-component system response regulator [Pseudomonadota bacterium]